MNIPEIEIRLQNERFIDVELPLWRVDWLKEHGHTVFCMRDNVYRIFKRI